MTVSNRPRVKNRFNLFSLNTIIKIACVRWLLWFCDLRFLVNGKSCEYKYLKSHWFIINLLVVAIYETVRSATLLVTERNLEPTPVFTVLSDTQLKHPLRNAIRFHPRAWYSSQVSSFYSTARWFVSCFWASLENITSGLVSAHIYETAGKYFRDFNITSTDP